MLKLNNIRHILFQHIKIQLIHIQNIHKYYRVKRLIRIDLCKDKKMKLSSSAAISFCNHRIWLVFHTVGAIAHVLSICSITRWYAIFGIPRTWHWMSPTGRHGRWVGGAAPGPDSCTSLSCFGQGLAEEGQSSPWRRQSSRPHCLHCQRHWQHPCHGPSCASWERRGGCRTCHSPWSCTCRACHWCGHESVSCGRLSLQTSYRTHQTHTWRASLLKRKKNLLQTCFSNIIVLLLQCR